MDMKQLLNQIGTFGIVTVVTFMVWLYAEDANVVEYTGQTVRLQFTVPEGSDGQISPAAPITVEVDFNSSNGQYQQFISETRGKPIVIDNLPFKPDQDLETIEVNIEEQLKEYIFGDMGINLTRVSPDRLAVTFEKNVDISLDVRIVQETGSIKLSAAQIPDEEDRRIKLVGIPASQAAQLVGVNAVVRIREQDVQDVPKGESKQINDLPVELPARLRDLVPITKSIDVVVTVANDRDRVTIERRPILLSYPSSINERYVVEIDEADRFITAFELEGPRQQIELLKQDQTSAAVWATIRLTNEEADAAAVTENGELTKAVEIVAPPGVVLASDVQRVTIRIKPRSAPTTP